MLWLLWLCATALAWGPTGHRAVGLIAERHLDADSAKQLATLMGSESLPRASTWPDHVRSDTAFDWAAPLPEALRQLAPAHSTQWHYLNVDPGQRISEARLAQPENLPVALARFVALAGNIEAQPEARRIAVRWIVHLVGDAHQPLHLGHRDDQGATLATVQWFEEPTNLHRVWDEHLIAHTDLSYTELVDFIDHAPDSQVSAWRAASVERWLEESLALVEGCYPDTAKLDWSYAYTHKPTMERRLVQAGVRLAATLERAFPPASVP